MQRGGGRLAKTWRPPTAEIERGRSLLSVQDAGSSLLVAAKAEDCPRIGWAHRHELTLRR